MSSANPDPLSIFNETDEICPSCGEFGELDVNSGWCRDCTNEHAGIVQFPSSPTGLSYLKVEAFLEANADSIEFDLLRGFSLSRAIENLSAVIQRPTCIVCGRTIDRARRHSVFCRRTKECRKWARRYVYLYSYTNPRLTKPESLARVLEELAS